MSRPFEPNLFVTRFDREISRSIIDKKSIRISRDHLSSSRPLKKYIGIFHIEPTLHQHSIFSSEIRASVVFAKSKPRIIIDNSLNFTFYLHSNISTNVSKGLKLLKIITRSFYFRCSLPPLPLSFKEKLVLQIRFWMFHFYLFTKVALLVLRAINVFLQIPLPRAKETQYKAGMEMVLEFRTMVTKFYSGVKAGLPSFCLLSSRKSTRYANLCSVVDLARISSNETCNHLKKRRDACVAQISLLSF